MRPTKTICALKAISFIALMATTQGKAAPLDACTKTMASAPYCMTILTARANCAHGPQEIKSIQGCMQNMVKHLGGPPVPAKFKQMVYTACVIDEVSISNSPENKSLCIK